MVWYCFTSSVVGADLRIYPTKCLSGLLDCRRLHHRHTSKVRIYMKLTSKSSTSHQSSFATPFNCRSCEYVDALQRFRLIDFRSLSEGAIWSIAVLELLILSCERLFVSFCSKVVENFLSEAGKYSKRSFTFVKVTTAAFKSQEERKQVANKYLSLRGSVAKAMLVLSLGRVKGKRTPCPF